MRNRQVEVRQLGASQLRDLLTLSRELFQTDEASSSLGLVGRALVEMIQPDSALLLVRGDRLDIVRFDSRGAAHPAGTDHPLYQTGIALLSGVSPGADEKLCGNQQCEHVGSRTLAVAVPVHAAVAALAVLTDVLTGLCNRRGFFLQAEQIFKVSQRKRAKGAVIFADIDGLKRVNDELGHDAGDRLIRDAAIVFRQSFRQADVVSRLGGDEFVAYTLDDEQPEVILERIRANLRAFNLMQERPYTVAISAGVVQCDPSGAETLSHYVLLADEQMYAQKRSRLH